MSWGSGLPPGGQGKSAAAREAKSGKWLSLPGMADYLTGFLGLC